MSGGLDRRLWAISSVVILGAVMSILDTTIVNVAIDTLGRDLHASLGTIQWVSTGYMLALATVIPLTGWAAERFGTKRLFMLAVSLFVVGSALCGFAWSSESLIVFRVLQGLGGGMVMPVGMMILAQAAGPQRMGRVMSVIGVPMLIAPVIGPALGGYLIDAISWRWIFFVNIPVGAVALVLAARILDRDNPQERHAFDLRGFLLLSPGLTALVYGLAEAGSVGSLTAVKPLAAIGVGLLLIAAFVLVGVPHRAAAARPHAVPRARVLGLVRDDVPARRRAVRGDDPDAAVLPAGARLVGAGRRPAARSAGPRRRHRDADRRAASPTASAPAGSCSRAWSSCSLGTFAFTQVTASTSFVVLSVALYFRGIGLGMTMMPAMSAAYQVLDRAAVPRATTTLNILNRVGGALGTAILAVLLQSHIRGRADRPRPGRA